ncbi:hypothetical protein [Paucibacter sp. KBW04]|nr:hypothetical protein [Paucibacter sp. KBW04]
MAHEIGPMLMSGFELKEEEKEEKGPGSNSPIEPGQRDRRFS